MSKLDKAKAKGSSIQAGHVRQESLWGEEYLRLTGKKIYM